MMGNTGYSFDFNPRPREEGDIYTQSGWCAADYFNPRPREEGDLQIICLSGQ